MGQIDFGTWRNRLAAFLGMTHEGRRDLYEVYGYPKVLVPQDFYNLYRRSGFANRIVAAYPKATWRHYPCIRDEAGNSSEKGKEGFSPFYAAVETFFEEHGIMQVLRRFDELARIGRFGILVMGFQDGKDLREPVDEGKHKLIYLQPYGEPSVQVAQWDQDQRSPRFGKPLVYTVQTGNLSGGDRPAPMRAFQVHWTRVIHVAENLGEDGVYGLPPLEPIYNRIIDLEKVMGGGAEFFWLTGNGRLVLSADKEARLDEKDIEDMKKQADELVHQLRRIMVGTGINASLLGGGQSPDPGPNIDKLLDEVSGATGIPKRILIGSERGELASGQDENNWNARVDERREGFATPCILRPFINAMIATGNVPEPKGEWWPEWPEQAALGPVEESTVLVNRTNALATYSNSPAAQIYVPPQEFRKDFLGLEPESEFEIEEPEELIDETDPDLQGEPDPEPEPDAVANARARTLYAFRPVLNAKQILAWARSQGFKDLVPERELHVTLAYSRIAFDWMKAGGPWNPSGEDDTGRLMVPPGGVRIVEGLGNDGTIVLMFTHNELGWRHQQICAAGAEWPHDGYQPHITLSYGDKALNLDLVEPYTGAIALGPEVWREIKPEPMADAA